MMTITGVYIILLVTVGVGRLLEMRLSNRNRAQLLDSGAQAVTERYFPLMVSLHIGILVGSLIEVIAFERPFYPLLAIPCFILFVGCNLLRWWVIRVLGTHWNVKVMDSTGRGVVTAGPYRYIRHPNYTAVYFELLALPLIYTAWITALLGGILHIWVLWQRVQVEESVLLADSAYRAEMGDKARFIPHLF
jgi:methyltransferase